jgi:hypothetical protein
MQKVAYPENLEDSFISECIHSNEFIQGKVGETNYLYAYVNKRTQQTSRKHYYLNVKFNNETLRFFFCGKIRNKNNGKRKVYGSYVVFCL